MSLIPDWLLEEIKQELNSKKELIKPEYANPASQCAKHLDTLNKMTSEAEKKGFQMSSDLETGRILKSIIAAKPNSEILELGTGLGHSTSWILQAMCPNSNLTSIEIDADLQAIAANALGQDQRVKFICADVKDFLKNANRQSYDIIFADTIYGKYIMLEDSIKLLKKDGLFICDDINYQDFWPKEYEPLINIFLGYINSLDDLSVTFIDTNSGLCLARKKT